MNINAATLIHDRNLRGASIRDTIPSDRECQDTKSNDQIIEDTYESASVIEQYNNYSSSGVLHSAAAPGQSGTTKAAATYSDVGINRTQNKATPDINAYHRWEYPFQKKVDESDGSHQKTRPSGSHELSSAEGLHKRYSFLNGGEDYSPESFKLRMTLLLMNILFGTGDTDYDDFTKRIGEVFDSQNWLSDFEALLSGLTGSTSDGRKAADSEQATNGEAQYDARLQGVGWTLHNRKMINSQLSELFRKNGIEVPADTRLTFVIDSQYRLRVTGTDDEDLVKQIEDALNKNGNAANLYQHIYQSTGITGGERVSNQVREDSLRMYQVDWAIREYTGYQRQDLDLVDGKFLTKDGVDIAELIKKGVAGYFNDSSSSAGILTAYNLNEIEWLAKVGPENIPEMTLSIDFENGSLYDVGQPHGYGVGQTDWLRSLLPA